ncbi:MAG: hypothetical protein Ct9H300mP1_29440 [Planctomycetaceae bacterium]|nr:MAG: hypothetical protein Ct9H300mP1_29440 [Planctomycetaceae bacterium]
MIVHWPGQVPAGGVSEKPTVNVDFYPTLLEAADAQGDPKHVVDGQSTLATWKGQGGKAEDRDLYWHYPLDRPHFLGGRSAGAIRDGDWKLIEFFDTGKRELFSLSADPSERHDRSAEHPKLVDSLATKLAAWRDSVGARLPSPPLLAEPRRLYFSDHFSAGQVSSRWAFSGDWSAKDGVLERGKTAKSTTRIFLKRAEYRDVVIRFDFQFRKAGTSVSSPVVTGPTTRWFTFDAITSTCRRPWTKAGRTFRIGTASARTRSNRTGGTR